MELNSVDKQELTDAIIEGIWRGFWLPFLIIVATGIIILLILLFIKINYGFSIEELIQLVHL
ncbi:MAG: hypothetical protein J5U19_11145 [Candidatus Methanoperedens sp.]|nr:hypothetical protein [Candidatus Methanoperedens sp.]MCE8428933.1 hypothetical protein [Candidatus Methanoperedens sp.]